MVFICLCAFEHGQGALPVSTFCIIQESSQVAMQEILKKALKSYAIVISQDSVGALKETIFHKYTKQPKYLR